MLSINSPPLTQISHLTTATMTSRTASHAGSWYTEDSTTLSTELDQFLERVPSSVEGHQVPVAGARVIIAPSVGPLSLSQTSPNQSQPCRIRILRPYRSMGIQSPRSLESETNLPPRSLPRSTSTRLRPLETCQILHTPRRPSNRHRHSQGASCLWDV